MQTDNYSQNSLDYQRIEKAMQFMTLDYTNKKLRESSSTLETAFTAGLSGSSRLHDLFVTFEAMTPDEFKK